MITGLDEIHKETQEAEAAALQRRNRIRMVFIDDGEFAELRFLTAPDQVIKAKFHRIEEDTPKGRKWVNKYCTYADLGSCQYCAGGHSPQKKIFLWAYVKTIYHTKQNPYLAKNPNADKWERVSGSTTPLFKEVCNVPMIFRVGPGKDNAFQNSLIDFANEYGGLTDRDYKFIRSGAELKTSYRLVARDPNPSEFAEIMAEWKDKMPDLGEVVIGRTKTFIGMEEEDGGVAAAEATEAVRSVGDSSEDDLPF